MEHYDLEADQEFITQNNDRVKLDRPVPGDGSKWYVAIWWGGSWAYLDNVIEPGDLKEMIVP